MKSNEYCNPNLFEIEDGVLVAFFAKRYEMNCVAIPPYVTAIAPKAFEESKMKEVEFLGDIESIGDEAFLNCENLTKITLPDSLREIGKRAFYGCSSLSKIRIPGGVKDIKSETFCGCGDLDEIEIADGVESLGGDFLAGTGVEELNLPASVKHIDAAAFVNTYYLDDISVDERNPVYKKMDECLFSADGKTLICVPRTVIESEILDGVTRIEDHAFAGCDGLCSVTIPDTVKHIGKYAFFGCEALQSVQIPNGVTRIEDHAFTGCSGLCSVEIPDTVKYIGGSAFCDCEALESVQIPNGVTKILKDTFRSCEALESVTIPGSVREIDFGAFYQCYSLVSVFISQGLKRIRDDAFASCEALSKITLPAGLRTIDDAAFMGCNLKSINIPSSVVRIGGDVTQGCDEFAKIDFEDPEGWAYIDEDLGDDVEADADPSVLSDPKTACEFYLTKAAEHGMWKKPEFISGDVGGEAGL